MSRITKALGVAEKKSIPYKRTEEFKKIIDEVMKKISDDIKISILYNGESNYYKLFIKHFYSYLSEEREIILASNEPEKFSGNAMDFESLDQDSEYILDNIHTDDSYVLFIAENADFYFLHNFPKEKLIGAVIIS